MQMARVRSGQPRSSHRHQIVDFAEPQTPAGTGPAPARDDKPAPVAFPSVECSTKLSLGIARWNFHLFSRIREKTNFSRTLDTQTSPSTPFRVVFWTFLEERERGTQRTLVTGPHAPIATRGHHSSQAITPHRRLCGVGRRPSAPPHPDMEAALRQPQVDARVGLRNLAHPFLPAGVWGLRRVRSGNAVCVARWVGR